MTIEVKPLPLSIVDDLGASARDIWLAHRAAIELASATTAAEFRNVLETFEMEPLDCLHAYLGSYLEDRDRAERSPATRDDNPF